MLKTFKTEINPTPSQATKIRQTIGVSRFIYNFYLSHNKQIYAAEKRFVSGMEFSKWLNNSYTLIHPEQQWIKSVSSKATKQAIMNAETAFKRFFQGKSNFPKYKKKKNQDVKAYFPKNNLTDWTVERHKIKIPTLGFIHLKEKGYIPTKGKVTSGTISTKAGKYFVSVLIDLPEKQTSLIPSTPGIGVDLGLKDFAICSHKEKPYQNINKTKPVKKLEKKLKREQRRLSRKYQNKKKRGETTATYSANIVKQVKQVQAIHLKLANIRTDYINKVVSELVKTKPIHITIEDLKVSGMMKNRCLSKAIVGQKFYEFRIKLTCKCKENNIELRIADRWYPSSKTCSHCGHIKKDLSLSDRTYICTECGLTLDRDKNASLNLANATIYKVAH